MPVPLRSDFDALQLRASVRLQRHPADFRSLAARRPISRPDKARSCAEEIDGISTNYAIERIGVG